MMNSIVQVFTWFTSNQLFSAPLRLWARKEFGFLHKVLYLIVFLLSLGGLTSLALAQSQATLRGVVVDGKGPVAGAQVRIQLSDKMTLSAKDGSFTLSGVSGSDPLTVTAWAPGYYIGWNTAIANGAPLTITLNAHYVSDNANYEWFEQKFGQSKIEGSAACGVCHTANPEWQQDAHAQSASNVRFQTLYNGTDVQGRQSPLTKRNPDGSADPPDPSQPYFGPGFQLDNQGRAGSCATCHTPAAAKLPNNQNCAWSGCHQGSTLQHDYNLPDVSPWPTGLKGDAAEGISCEFCHKIGAVTINKKTGLPYEDSPGILSLRLFRPSQPGQDIFFGPFDDVVRTDLPEARDSYLPLQSESKFCAGCHYGVLGGVVGNMQVSGGLLVYSSYMEWLASPYSDPETGKTCQDCHMPSVDYDYFVFLDKGGTRRNPQQINNHRMLGKNDADFLASAVSMTATARLQNNQVAVTVSVVNDNAGHAVPTDSVLHHVILAVEVRDENGKQLALRSGAALPAWSGDYAGLPGRTFAKIIKDKWTGDVPSAAFWRQAEVAADTRLQPFIPQSSHYIFAGFAGQTASVEVKLIYRRAFQELMQQKGWEDPDIVMKQTKLKVSK
jgi:hypothetical protein